MKDFESLLKALEGSFEASLTKLPDSIRDRVERDFPRGRHGPLWDDLSVDHRRVAAQQWDSQHDPAVEKERQSAWDLVVRKGEIEQELEKWKMVATPTATDLARQETRIAELENELFRLEQQERSFSQADKSEAQLERIQSPKIQELEDEREQLLPCWMIKHAGGNRWLCGLENDLKPIRGTEGFKDLRYAVQADGKDCDPRAYMGNDVQSADKTHFGSSFEALDAETMRQIKNAIEDEKADFKSAKESGDFDAIEVHEVELKKLEDYLRQNTMPGGKSRKMTEGDPRVNALKAMRGRKDTVLKNLRNAGLNEMADDIKENYALRTRSFAYIGSSLKVS